MFTSGFFNSINSDRKYNAEQMAAIFDGLITDGIFDSIGDHFQVTPASSGLGVNIGTGRAWLNQTWSYNDTAYPVTLGAASPSLSRKDLICLKVDKSSAVRSNSLVVIAGTPAASPVEPTVTDDTTNGIYYHKLAAVTVQAGATSISAADITNYIGLSTGTPYVTGIIESTAVDELWSQWDGEFNDWWDDIKATLDDNIVTTILNKIDHITPKEATMNLYGFSHIDPPPEGKTYQAYSTDAILQQISSLLNSVPKGYMPGDMLTSSRDMDEDEFLQLDGSYFDSNLVYAYGITPSDDADFPSNVVFPASSHNSASAYTFINKALGTNISGGAYIYNGRSYGASCGFKYRDAWYTVNRCSISSSQVGIILVKFDAQYPDGTVLASFSINRQNMDQMGTHSYVDDDVAVVVGEVYGQVFCIRISGSNVTYNANAGSIGNNTPNAYCGFRYGSTVHFIGINPGSTSSTALDLAVWSIRVNVSTGTVNVDNVIKYITMPQNTSASTYYNRTLSIGIYQLGNRFILHAVRRLSYSSNPYLQDAFYVYGTFQDSGISFDAAEMTALASSSVSISSASAPRISMELGCAKTSNGSPILVLISPFLASPNTDDLRLVLTVYSMATNGLAKIYESTYTESNGYDLTSGRVIAIDGVLSFIFYRSGNTSRGFSEINVFLGASLTAPVNKITYKETYIPTAGTIGNMINSSSFQQHLPDPVLLCTVSKRPVYLFRKCSYGTMSSNHDTYISPIGRLLIDPMMEIQDNTYIMAAQGRPKRYVKV